MNKKLLAILEVLVSDKEPTSEDSSLLKQVVALARKLGFKVEKTDAGYSFFVSDLEAFSYEGGYFYLSNAIVNTSPGLGERLRSYGVTFDIGRGKKLMMFFRATAEECLEKILRYIYSAARKVR